MPPIQTPEIKACHIVKRYFAKEPKHTRGIIYAAQLRFLSAPIALVAAAAAIPFPKTIGGALTITNPSFTGLCTGLCALVPQHLPPAAGIGITGSATGNMEPFIW